MQWGVFAAASRPDSLAAIPELSHIAEWSSVQGLGQLFSNRHMTGSRVYLRGGLWYTGEYAGVLGLNMNITELTSFDYTGFRAAR